MRYTIKTVDGNRYELPSGVQPVLINKFYMKWLTFPGKDCHLKYLNVDNIVSITETIDALYDEYDIDLHE